MLIQGTVIRLVHVAPSYLLRACLIGTPVLVTAPSVDPDEVRFLAKAAEIE